MSRKLILIDLDGVVYNWIEAMVDMMEYNDVVPLERDLMSEHKTWEVWEDWGISKGEFHRWWRLGVEEGNV